jgi:nucleoside-diphosphate-sugar epimerase
MAGIIHPKKIPELYAINARGTQNMLAAAAEAGVRRFVFISSNSVGGVRRNGGLMTEQDPPSPYFHYGKSKHLAEKAVERYRDRMETVILRPCWYYGPNQPDRQTTFFRMIKKGRPIVFGSGKNDAAPGRRQDVLDCGRTAVYDE